MWMVEESVCERVTLTERTTMQDVLLLLLMLVVVVMVVVCVDLEGVGGCVCGWKERMCVGVCVCETERETVL